jgi:hypothetical protein
MEFGIIISDFGENETESGEIIKGCRELKPI